METPIGSGYNACAWNTVYGIKLLHSHYINDLTEEQRKTLAEAVKILENIGQHKP